MKSKLILFAGIVLIIFFVYVSIGIINNNNDDNRGSKNEESIIDESVTRCNLDDGTEITTGFKTCQEYFKYENEYSKRVSKIYDVYIVADFDEEMCEITLGKSIDDEVIGYTVTKFEGKKIPGMEDYDCEPSFPFISGDKNTLNLTDKKNSFYFYNDSNTCIVYHNGKEKKGNSVKECAKLGSELF